MSATSEQKRDVLSRLERLDMRYIYLIFAILLVIPVLRPVGLPVMVTPPTRDLYNYIETKISRGDRVLVWGTMTLGYYPTEYKPGAVAVAQHLLDKGAKLYYISDGPEDPMLVETTLDLVSKGSAKYGVDYVNLGYYAGGEVAHAAFAKDVNSLVKTDYYRTPVDQIPMMKEVMTAKDFKLAIHETGSPAEMLLRQYKTAYGIDCGFIAISGMVAIYMPYYASGQAVGFVGGLRGGAEYETLRRRPGSGLASTDAVSVGYVFFAAIMLLANVVYFANKRRVSK